MMMDDGKAPRSWIWEKRRRVLSTIVSRTADPSNTLALSVSAFSVYVIAFVEGWLRSATGHSQRLPFCLTFARHQLIPSIIWLTSDPNDIAAKFKDNVSLLRTLDASFRRKIFFLTCLRSVIFGFVGIAQILRIVEIASTSENEYRARVLDGREPLMDDGRGGGGGMMRDAAATGEAAAAGVATTRTASSSSSAFKHRVVRLAGTKSDVTEYSLQRFGHHIVPVYEDKEKCRPLIEEWTEGGAFPLVWCIDGGGENYGKRRSWAGFGSSMSKNWLLPVLSSSAASSAAAAGGDEGKKHHHRHADKQSASSGGGGGPRGGDGLFVVEADSSVGDQSLAMTDGSCNDLELSETAQAFSMLRRMALDAKVIERDDQMLRVLLLDRHAPKFSGGGNSIPSGQYVLERKEADVILDARAPLMKAIVNWVRSTGGSVTTTPTGTPSSAPAVPSSGSTTRTLIFDTDHEEYFKAVSSYLKAKPQHEQSSSSSTDHHNHHDQQQQHESVVILDRHSPQLTSRIFNNHSEKHDEEEEGVRADREVPRLVYAKTTQETLAAGESLLRSKLCTRKNLCLLLDNPRGVNELKEHGLEGVSYVCSAVIYDELFERVRHLACEGVPFPRIQQIMDEETKV